MNDYYDRDGNPIDFDWWMEMLSADDNRQIGYDRVGDLAVSTIWLGLNHNWSPDGRPLIFETLTHPGDYTECDLIRYSTLAEAEAGHKAAVARLQEAS